MLTVESVVTSKQNPDIGKSAAADAERWYAIRVRSQFEMKASAVLRGKGFEEFVPTYRSNRQWSDRVKSLDLPLFPGYVFCRFRTSDQYLVLNTSGIVHIVSNGSRPSPVDDIEIASVRTICTAGLPASPWLRMAEGQRVVVSRGPLKGAEGVVVEIKDRYRLVAAISLLQRAVSIELETEWITTVPS